MLNYSLTHEILSNSRHMMVVLILLPTQNLFQRKSHPRKIGRKTKAQREVLLLILEQKKNF